MMVEDTYLNLLHMRQGLFLPQETTRLNLYYYCVPYHAFYVLFGSSLSYQIQLEKHEEALVDEERWRSLHEVNLFLLPVLTKRQHEYFVGVPGDLMHMIVP